MTMKYSARILVPVVAAVALAGGVLGYAWWQLSTVQRQLQEQVRTIAEREDAITSSGSGSAAVNDYIDSGDIVLVHLRQGDILGLRGDWAAAEKEYQISVNAGGGIPALRKLASAQIQRREIPQVRETIRELRRLGARSEDLLLLDVIVALRTGELVQAQQALASAQDSPQKHYGSALLAIIKEEHELAKQELAAVIGGWDPALRSYGRILRSAYDEFALFPESRAAHLTALLARALAQVQECELALPLIAGVVKEEDDYRDAWMVQGYCELITERAPEALDSLNKAYSIDPEKPEIQYFLGRAHMALNQWTNASTFFQYALVNGFEPKKELRERLAEAAENAQDLPLALEQYRALIAEPGSDINIFERTISLALETGKNEDAYQFAQSAVKKWPDNARIMEMLGWSAAETGRKDEAKAALEKATLLDPELESARERLNTLK
ncbi:tetratricopeptide repeat protein [Candidatus Peregrinibacteria bacterium]|nr:tetratricopeptide repeat protein [Candidatus Peregrinibacteria bacterium]